VGGRGEGGAVDGRGGKGLLRPYRAEFLAAVAEEEAV